MNRDDLHPNGGAGPPAAPIAQTSAVPFGRGQRRRLVARALLLVLVFGSLGAGALADLGLYRLGLRWPPVFTAGWGIGALVLIGVAWTRLGLEAAADRAARRRVDG